MGSTPSTTTTPQTTAASAEPVVFAGRYRCLRELGKGGMGTVELAEDFQTAGRLVAIKRVHAAEADADAIVTLRNEFLALAVLRHPGLAKVYDFGYDRETGDSYFTSEFVEGSELLVECRKRNAARPEDLKYILDLVVQVLRGLEFIHSRGLVHGDIKPANILVTAAESDGGSVAKLIDFGLTKREKDFGGRRLIGTAYYIAPESITGSQVDRRTDLYSFGAVLYRLVTGRVPFQGRSKLAVLKGHLESVPLMAVDVVPGIPPGLSDVIARLLQKVPAQRYPTALHVIEALNEACGTSYALETADTALSYLEAPHIEARENFLRTLYRLFHSACGIDARKFEQEELELARFSLADTAAFQTHWLPTFPKGRLALIRGERGVGKGGFVLELRILTQTRGAAFLAVPCASEQPGVRHEDFERLLDHVQREIIGAERHPSFLAAKQLLASARGEIQTSVGIRKTLSDLTYFLLDWSRKQPVVLHVGGLHDAQELILDFVEIIVESQACEIVPESHLLMTATIVDEAVDVDGRLAGMLRQPEWQDWCLEVPLARLHRSEVVALLASVFPGNDFAGGFIRQLAATSDGNPQVITQICQHYIEQGVVARTAAGWTLERDFRKVDLPLAVRKELKARIMGLSTVELKLAVAFAFLGDPTEAELAGLFARVPADARNRALQSLGREHLLRPEGNGWSFVHSSAREILYGLVPRDERNAFHERAGVLCQEFYRSLGSERPRKLARHFLAAENVEQGVRYGLEAARLYEADSKFHLAVETYQSVAKLQARGPADELQRTRLQIADLQVRLGDYLGARSELQSLAMQLPDEHEWRARVEVDLAAIHTATGDFDAAKEALDHLGESEARDGPTRWTVLGRLARARLAFVQGRYSETIADCHEVLEHRDVLEGAEILAGVFILLAESHFYMGDRVNAIGQCVRALNMLDAAPHSRSSDAALFCLGKLHKFKDKFALARNQFRFCADLRRRIGLRDAQAEALIEVGGIELFLGRVRHAADALGRAVKLHEECGNNVALVKALNLLAEAHRRQGQYEDAGIALEKALGLARLMGNERSLSEALFVLAKMSLDGGQIERALGFIDTAYPGDPSEPRVLLKLLDFQCGLYQVKGDYWHLLKEANRGLEVAQESRLHFYVERFLVHLVLAQLRLGNTDDAERFIAELCELDQRSRSAVSQGRTLFLEALVFDARGEKRRAATYFGRAEKILVEEASERDLLRLYFHYGRFLVREKRFEDAFLAFEEGNYLAKKLKLNYWKAQFAFARGEFELQSDDASPLRAKRLFREAERYAERAPYAAMLGRIRQKLASLSTVK